MAAAAPIIAMHCQGCSGGLPESGPGQAEKTIGKAYLFAPRDLVFPELKNIQVLWRVGEFPGIADVPAAGTTIKQGNPIMTLLVTGRDEPDCHRQLMERACLFYEIAD